MTYDAFICHASEDKESFARPLAKSLVEAGLCIWYDEFSLKVGDSLRQAIERGLRESRFGIVIISEAFFAKKWPQTELDGLFEMEAPDHKVILPVWHNITRDQVLAVSPIFAGRHAALSIAGLDNVVEKLLDAIDSEAVHKTISGKTLFASPSALSLHHGEWTVKTPVMVINRGSKLAHSVCLKLTLDGTGVTAESVSIESNLRSTSLEGQVQDISVQSDLFRVDAVDSHDKEAVFLVFHTIAPNSHREIIVSGSIAVPSKATVELAAFDDTPTALLEGAGGVSLPFKLPETVTVKAISLLMRRP
jgi:hypothetical protein